MLVFCILLILIIGILFIGSFLYRLNETNRYRSLIKEFNDKQWTMYDNELKKVESESIRLVNCRAEIDKLKDSLLSDYKSILVKELNENELSEEEKYKKTTFKRLEDLSGELYGLTYWYDSPQSGKRNFEWGIFIVDRPSNYNEKSYQKEKVDAEENYKYKVIGLNEDLNKIKNIHCPKLPNSLIYQDSIEACEEFFLAKNSFREKPRKEENELEEEFQLRLATYEKDIAFELGYCSRSAN